MKIVGDVPADLIRDPRARAHAARGYLYGTVFTNRILMRLYNIPPLYESGVVFGREPWAPKVDEFEHCVTALARGWADCDGLVAWRVAELREQGEPAGIRIYWRDPRDGAQLFHAQVRRGDGSVEDPARMLGM